MRPTAAKVMGMFMSDTAEVVAKLRLWQLISPALPIGSYAYSAALEAAVERGTVHDEASALDWIVGVCGHGLASLDVPLLQRFYHAWSDGDLDAIDRWAAFLRAARETSELESEDRQLGVALARVLAGLGIEEAHSWMQHEDASYPCMFALAAVRWGIDCRDAAWGLMWAWCENQVTASMKLLPIGQSAGQRMLSAAAALVPAVVERGFLCDDQSLGMQMPGFALCSALHETQYSRLFRS